MEAPEPQPQREARAKEYARLRRRLFFIDLALGALFLLALLLSGLSQELSDHLPSSQPARVALYFIILILGYGLITAPLTFYGGYLLPHRYGLSHQSLTSWLLDLVKGGLIGMGLGIGIMVMLYELLWRFPDTWWLWAAGFVLAITVLLTNLAPIIIFPLFFKFKPLNDPDLSRRLLSLAERANARACGVFTMNLSTKSTAANAALVGLGNTRRIVLADNLLQGYSPEEIELVLAHELGHHLHADIAKSMAAQSAVVLGGFFLANLVLKGAVASLGFQGINDVAAFPLLALVVGGFSLAAMPLDNAYSRRLEEAADQYALIACDNPGAFISLMTKLARQNLAEEQPSRWVELLFYDHPPPFRRVELAQRYQEIRSLRQSS